MGAHVLQSKSAKPPHIYLTLQFRFTNLHSSLLQIFLLSRHSFSAEIMDSVTRMVADKSVVIFSKSSCCMSHSIKTLITSFGANPTVYELDEMPNGKQIEAALLQLGCRPSVPAVFIGQQFIGGAKEVMSLQVRNELPQLLMRAGAIWV